MKRKLNRIMLATTLSALFGSFVVNAQSKVVTAEIPFDYHVSSTVFPAGNYRVEQLRVGTMFQLSDGRGHSIFVAAPTMTSTNPDRPHLSFLRSGDDYVLSAISMPGNNVGQAVTNRDIERSLTRKIGIASVVNVAIANR